MRFARAWALVALFVASPFGHLTAGETAFSEFSPLSSPCCALCDSDHECCDDWCDCQRILGMLPSDHCFDDFVSPLSNPFFFEDPRSLTEARVMFLEQSLPNTIRGGDAQIYAGQMRGRITDRVSLIAPRLAYFNVNQAGGDGTWGFMSAPIGGKWNFYRDVEAQQLATLGMTYFINGQGRAASNFGDGDFHFFLTGGTAFLERGHWLSGTGFRLPANVNWNTQMWYWSNQWDYEFVDNWYGLLGINWFHWMRSAALATGPGGGSNVTGLDLVNVPAGGVAGDSVVTCMVGGKWKPSGNFELGTGFEFPLTGDRDVLRNRLYVDLIFRY